MYKISFKVSLFVIILMLPAAIYAAGLGKLILNSALGQPLNAEIDIVTTDNDEIPTLKAGIAPREAFAQAGINYESVLSTVKISVESRINGNPYIKLTSPQAVNDPFLMVLIELSWSSGRILREYTVLLDPVEVNAQNLVAPSAISPPPVISTQLEADEISSNKSKRGLRASKDVTNQGSKTYGPVNRGDTLSSIARRVLPAGVNLNQMLVALHRANREAFISNNMNLLKVGAVLTIPDSSEIASIDTTTAAAEVKMQTSDWRQYQSKLASISKESPAPQSISQSDQGKIATVIDKRSSTAADAPKEVLKLSSGGQLLDKDDQLADASLIDRLRMMEEDAVARNLALKEANERVAMLEKSIANLKHLLELKDSVLAQAQMSAESLPGNASKTETPAPFAVDAPVEADTAVGTHSPSVEAPAPVTQSPGDVSPAIQPAFIPEEEEQPVSLTGLIMAYIEYAAAVLVLLLLLLLLAVKRRRNQALEEFDDDEIKKENFSSTMRSRMASMAGASTAAAATAVAVDEQSAAGSSDELTYDNINTYDESSDQVDSFDKNADYYEEDVARDEDSIEAVDETIDDQPVDTIQENQPLDMPVTGEYSDERSDQSIDSTAADNQSMDFTNEVDFNLSDEPVQASGKPAVEPSFEIDFENEAEESMATDANSEYPLEIDFDVDGKASGALNMEEGIAEKPDTDDVLDFDRTIDLTSEEPVLSNELPSENDESPLAQPAELEQSLESVESDSIPNVPELDLAGIDLNLEEPNPDEQVDQASDLESNSELWQEVETKLDLAKAYQEMDDKEGAREMLEEVIRDGNEKQQKIARKILKSL